MRKQKREGGKLFEEKKQLFSNAERNNHKERKNRNSTSQYSRTRKKSKSRIRQRGSEHVTARIEIPQEARIERHYREEKIRIPEEPVKIDRPRWKKT